MKITVPIYKVEPFLRRCVDSILSQTYTDFELILVDDGSPDNCGTICDVYKKGQPRSSDTQGERRCFLSKKCRP